MYQTSTDTASIIIQTSTDTTPSSIQFNCTIEKEIIENIIYFTKCDSSYKDSFVDALKSIGENSSFSYRKEIAILNNITDYSGKSEENKKLLDLLLQGKLIKSIVKKVIQENIPCEEEQKEISTVTESDQITDIPSNYLKSPKELVIGVLKIEEGFNCTPYIDTLGHPTIGYGRLCSDKTFSSREEAFKILLSLYSYLHKRNGFKLAFWWYW